VSKVCLEAKMKFRKAVCLRYCCERFYFKRLKKYKNVKKQSLISKFRKREIICIYFGQCIVKLSLPWMRRRRISGIECHWRNTSFHRTWLHR